MKDAREFLRACRVNGVAWARGRRLLMGGDGAGGGRGAIMPFIGTGVLGLLLPAADLWAIQGCGDDDEPPHKMRREASETQL